jgi:trehalose-6-phosphate synthase
MKRFGAPQYMLVGICVIAFAILAITESSPEEPSKSVTTKVTEESGEDIQAIQTLTSKQEQYCYRINKHLPEPQLTQQIEICLTQTANWTLEQFEAAMPE